MARPKSRTALLADALSAARKAQEALTAIDLRTTRGDLRDAVRDAREDVANLTTNLGTALEHDLPTPAPRHRVAQSA
jgi:hypothetical protein